jgi:hypothetical protein
VPFERDAAVVPHVCRFDHDIVHAAGNPTRLERSQQLRRNPHGTRAVFVAMTGITRRERGETG